MSETPNSLRYSKTHEWTKLDDDGTVVVGISDHAQDALGDVVYVELPEVGVEVTGGQEVAVVESVKAASDIYSPVSGEIVAVNELLADAPETLNQSPYDKGWIFRVKIADRTQLDDLLDADAYNQQLSDE